MTMEFSGEHRIAARQKQVWAALGDPAVMQACIVGCSRVEKISDSEMVATVVVAVGPISATFKGTVALTNLSGPIGYTLIGEGGATNLARIEAQVSLAEDQNETVLKYVATTDFCDKLGGVGGLLVQTVSEMSADEFFAEFSRHLDAAEVNDAVVPAAVAASVPGAVQPKAAEPACRFGFQGTRAHGLLVVIACGLGFALGYGFARWI
jgi:carbon monoxide dehydrogenase subunit G